MGSKKLPFSEFVRRAHETHGETTYDYSKITVDENNDVVGMKKLHTIICNIHGKFLQTPANHSKKTKCPICAVSKRSYNTDSLIKKINELYDTSDIDFSKTIYTGYNENISFGCNKHPDQIISITARKLLTKKYMVAFPKICKHCKDDAIKKEKLEKYLIEVKKVHGDYFDYSRLEYNGIGEFGVFGCPVHGWFKRTLYEIKNGRGCGKCGITAKHDKLRMTEETFKRRANAKHENKYLYDFPSDYKNSSSSDIQIKCPDHGWFTQKLVTTCTDVVVKCAEDRTRWLQRENEKFMISLKHYYPMKKSRETLEK